MPVVTCTRIEMYFLKFFSSWKEQDIFVDSLLAKLENSAAEEVVKYANEITPFFVLSSSI